MDKPFQNRRLVQVYTGPGKGKTTSAMGLALRACGHNWKVLMICFMKGDPNYGEVKSSKEIKNFTLIQSGLTTFIKKGDPSPEDIRLAKEGWEKAIQALKDDTLDLLILDEINVAVDYGLIPLEDVINLIENKPDHVELVLTGRYAHREIQKRADLVSEILEIKHPYQNGIPSREGIDY
jgi:cob(I)alamin adenosyltransferase